MEKDYNDEILNYNYDDDQEDYENFSKYLKEHTERQKNKSASELFENGDKLLKEIDRKKIRQNIEKQKIIKRILRRTKHYERIELESYSVSDIRDIYKKLKENSFLNNIIKIFLS